MEIYEIPCAVGPLTRLSCNWCGLDSCWFWFVVCTRNAEINNRNKC